MKKRILIFKNISLESVAAKMALYRKIISSFLIILLVIYLIVWIIAQMGKEVIVITSFQVPPGFSEKGFSEQVIINRFLDKINVIYQSVLTEVKPKNISATDNQPGYNIMIPETGISINGIVEHLRGTFGKQAKILSGEMVTEKNEITMTVRFSDQLPYTKTLPGSDPAMVLDSLLINAAKYFYLHTQPFILAAFYLNKRDYAGFDQMMKYSLQRGDTRFDYWAYHYLGEIYAINGSYEEAIEMYRQSIAVNPSYLPPYLGWADVYYKRKDLHKAEEKYLEAYEINPDLDSILVRLGDIYYQWEEWDKALLHYSRAIDLAVQAKTVYLNIIRLLKEKNDYEQAIQVVTEGLVYYPDHARMHLELASILRKNKLYDRAIEACREAIKMIPANKEIYLELGYNYYLKSDFKKAFESFLTCSEIDSTFPEAYLNLGRVSFARNDKENARKYFNKVIALENDSTATNTRSASKYLHGLEN